MKSIRIGTRGSALALMQAEEVRDRLGILHPDRHFEIITIKTKGDKILDSPLSKIGDKGLFTREIEGDLLAGKIDLAVHSMKDMPTAVPAGLAIGAVTGRLDPRDVFLSKGKKFSGLAAGNCIATGSLRRKAQLLSHCPGLTIIDLRGNVNTRIKKMHDNPGIDGIILAGAGISRLNISGEHLEVINEDIMLPAVGQAALAVEIRGGDPEMQKITGALNDRKTEMEIMCEREFLAALGGGCQVPIAGYAKITGDAIAIRGLVSSIDGTVTFADTVSDISGNYRLVGKKLAERLIRAGAGRILDEIYRRQ